jgi:hypothetical protein
VKPCIRQSRRRTRWRASGSVEEKDSRTTYERNSREIPKDDQEAPLLVVNIPGLGDAFLTLAAGAGLAVVQE